MSRREWTLQRRHFLSLWHALQKRTGIAVVVYFDFHLFPSLPRVMRVKLFWPSLSFLCVIFWPCSVTAKGTHVLRRLLRSQDRTLWGWRGHCSDRDGHFLKVEKRDLHYLRGEKRKEPKKQPRRTENSSGILKTKKVLGSFLFQGHMFLLFLTVSSFRRHILSLSFESSLNFGRK